MALARCLWFMRAAHSTWPMRMCGWVFSTARESWGGLISLVAVPVLVKRQAIGRVMAAFLAANVAAVALLAVAPSYGWALVLYCACNQLVYLMVTSTGITVRQMLSPDHLQARVNTAGRLIAYGGQPVVLFWPACSPRCCRSGLPSRCWPSASLLAQG